VEKRRRKQVDGEVVPVGRKREGDIRERLEMKDRKINRKRRM
jgi:hypothetical protein